ncbi:alpha/beta hydrolase family protein [Paenibacillus chondroitinus]|uniref:Alpha/beta hydrolase family protein n=1 Tax=Paenibacillus chondroitinus TaxID=59842 RepID=A0ABU6D9F6_9BACL|nr:alpha/beta hydrolase family protein [Paenibacillus chondroitinus]MCY9656733.1 alpha/beta hydrolase family protein [Paenibacillus anseongense]MEB4794382.1 alpha/beta hydrolase family protein [Paenibacillus chondroitinus]
MFEKFENVQIAHFDVKSQLPRWIYESAMRAAERGELARGSIANKTDLMQRQKEIREGILTCIGGLPASDTPLNPQITGKVSGNGFHVEKVIFEPRPLVYATANLYIPDDVTEPRGAVLVLCGHREQAKHCDEYQTVCHYLVHAGLIVLSLDPVGQGERFGFYDPETGQAPMTSVTEHENVGRQCMPVGDSLARYMLHDAMRAIDYLCTRQEVNPQRIGVTGHSGGGTQTSLLMMADERIAAAAPGGFIMNRPYFLLTGKAQDAEQKWPGFSALGFDHEDIVLAMAPRPVRVLATTYDSVPIEAPRHNVAVNRRFWDMYDKGELLDIFEDENAHRFSIPLARAAAEFFSEQLLGRKVTPQDDGIQLLPADQLHCTQSGQVIGECSGARNTHDENNERLAQLEKARHELPEDLRKKQALKWLRNAVYFNRKPCDLNPRLSGGGEVENLWALRTVWWSQRGLLNNALQFFPAEAAGRKLPVTIAVWDGGTKQTNAHAKWIEETCAAGRIALVLNPVGIGSLLPHVNSPEERPYKRFGMMDRYTDELMWLGDSMAAVRTYDVLRAIELAGTLKNIDADDIELYGSGKYAIYAELAALLDSRVQRVCLENRMSSLAQWIREPFYDENDSLSFILPGMLRYFDIPDADNWLEQEGRLGTAIKYRNNTAS